MQRALGMAAGLFVQWEAKEDTSYTYTCSDSSMPPNFETNGGFN
jgi:hypothetical protein